MSAIATDIEAAARLKAKSKQFRHAAEYSDLLLSVAEMCSEEIDRLSKLENFLEATVAPGPSFKALALKISELAQYIEPADANGHQQAELSGLPNYPPTFESPATEAWRDPPHDVARDRKGTAYTAQVEALLDSNPNERFTSQRVAEVLSIDIKHAHSMLSYLATKKNSIVRAGRGQYQSTRGVLSATEASQASSG